MKINSLTWGCCHWRWGIALAGPGLQTQAPRERRGLRALSAWSWVSSECRDRTGPWERAPPRRTRSSFRRRPAPGAVRCAGRRCRCMARFAGAGRSAGCRPRTAPAACTRTSTSRLSGASLFCSRSGVRPLLWSGGGSAFPIDSDFNARSLVQYQRLGASTVDWLHLAVFVFRLPAAGCWRWFLMRERERERPPSLLALARLRVSLGNVLPVCPSCQSHARRLIVHRDRRNPLA